MNEVELNKFINHFNHNYKINLETKLVLNNRNINEFIGKKEIIMNL